MNALVDQGLEFHVASSDFKAGDVDVKKGDWLIRGDQPFRTIADMYFSIQNYPTTNPSPYDDTGWTYPMMRNIILHEVKDAGVPQGADDAGDVARRRRGRHQRQRRRRSSSSTTATTT